MSGFRLATLERLREQSVEVAARALHEAGAELDQAQRHRQELAQALRNGAAALSAAPQQLVQASTYRDLLREQIAAAGVEISRRQGALAERRSAWVAANAQLRAVVALHDRYRLAKRTQLDRLEQRESDERAGNQAARRGRFDRPDVDLEVDPDPRLDAASLDQAGVGE